MLLPVLWSDISFTIHYTKHVTVKICGLIFINYENHFNLT